MLDGVASSDLSGNPQSAMGSYVGAETVQEFQIITNNEVSLGDLGGLEMAYSAYRLHDAQHGEPPVIDGLTGDQRFFMGWAQVWRRKYRDENLLTRLKTDPHSPSEYRCNGVVVNMPAFADAFMVKEGDKLYKAPEQRIKIW